MIEAKYYKDFRHNYLIITNEDFPTDTYQCKMITGNRIEGLVPCMERHINGETLLYYEITSKQSLASLYEDGGITMEQLNRLFLQIKRTWDGISKYLLKESSLVLQPEFIFADIETEEFAFLYYPFETEENYIVLLLEFLADKVNSEDKDAVEVTYKMLELATRDQFVLDEVLEWFKEDCNERMNEKREYPEYTEESDNSSSVESFEEEYSDWQGSKGNIEKRKKYNQKISYACMIVSIALEGILYYIYWGWELSEKMLIYLYTGAVMLGVLFLANGFWILYNKMFHGQSLIWDKIFDLRDKEREKEERPYQSTIISEKVQEQAKQAYGNTIFIPWIENCENKLYGTGKGNKNHIDLNRLPLTVGKLAGSVDMVIDDQSISRRHAKFIRDGNKIYMIDLNSTNGTFKNGLRLLPNTSEVLEPGDEIRLGKLKFIYR
ncbi:MAG: FHA domain-containing protein [Lachnospiraceae bacterium]|nr:FHA domain-containing protein [Lachnospiraceae bacterium]